MELQDVMLALETIAHTARALHSAAHAHKRVPVETAGLCLALRAVRACRRWRRWLVERKTNRASRFPFETPFSSWSCDTLYLAYCHYKQSGNPPGTPPVVSTR